MRKLSLFSFLLISTFLSPLSITLATAAPATKIVTGFAFDWDDNIFDMPTQIMLFNKKTGAEKGVSTAEFALIRSQIGQSGTPWAAYEMRDSLSDGSLRFFGDHAKEGKNSFEKDVQRAIKTPGYHWQGPVWNDFVAAMRDARTADETSIITARLHDPETIHAALEELRQQGLIQHVPPAKNIWAVTFDGFAAQFHQAFSDDPPAGGGSNPSARKAAVMEHILDSINARPLPSSGEKTLSASGDGQVLQHLWGFSDDDFGNFSKAVEVLQKGVDSGRWSHVKIALFFTGLNNPVEKPRAVVLRAKATPRPLKEIGEWKKVLAEAIARSTGMRALPAQAQKN